MGWKTIKGRRYFYKSERVGGRVQTTYCGAGDIGRLMAHFEAAERLEKLDEREKETEERAEAVAEDRAVSEWFDDVQAVADAAMISAAFHKHKGQWRRKRR
jgi:hypothetical protein